MLPEGYTDFDTHLVPYYVDRRYDYPRFVCYDCHAYTPYTAWDPYYAWCPRFTLVVWTDPFYYYPSYWYPTWYYGGSRVVYVNPGSTAFGSRYVFKERQSSQPGIDYRDRRRSEQAGRSPDRVWRGNDVGGVGSVPAPSGTGRRTVEPRRREAEGLSGPAWPGDRSSAPATDNRRSTPDSRGDWRTRYYTPGDQGTASPSTNPARGDRPGIRQEAGGELKPQQRLESGDRRGAPSDVQRADQRGNTRSSDRGVQGPSGGDTRGTDRGQQARSGGDRGQQVRSGGDGRRGASPEARPSSPPAASSPSRGSQPQARPQSAPASRGQSRPSNPGLVRRRGS